MASLNPEHLFAQADRLLSPTSAGVPRQVDLRRAISAAYYGLFHAVSALAADDAVGKSKRAEKRYALVYRSIGHRSLRDLCIEIKKPKLSSKYAPFQPAMGFEPNITAFAASFLELQEKRHDADYNPLIRFSVSDARLAIDTARSALKRFEKASKDSRTLFLTLLLFPPR